MFSGPYAAELDSAYRSATTAVARAILADGVITDAELAELKAPTIQCLEAIGFTDVTLENDGTSSYTVDVAMFPNPLDASALADKCECATGWSSLGPLYHYMRINPDNVDMAPLRAECLVRVGLRAEGYSAEDFRQEDAAGVFDPLFESQEGEEWEKFESCYFDPLHAK
jgi:hypothetical protein